MLVGTVGINVLDRINADHPQTLAILLVSYIMQGLGFCVSMSFIVVSQYRAIRYGFHRGASAASAFIAAGPPGKVVYTYTVTSTQLRKTPGFTALALVRLGQYGRDM